MASNFGFFDLLAFVTFSINAFSYMMRDIKWLRIVTIVAMVGDLFVYYNIRAGSPPPTMLAAIGELSSLPTQMPTTRSPAKPTCCIICRISL